MSEPRADWYPKAERLVKQMKTRGKYPSGYPRGAVVHFTSGRDGAEKSINGGIRNGYVFVCIQKDGKMFQAHPISEWGSHAGKSKWKGLDGTVSNELIGIEINCAGRVKLQADGRFKTWFDTYVDQENVRYSDGTANQSEGYYEAYTPEQEKTLTEFLLWLKSQAPETFSFDFVLGHDEVASPKGRKTDPGASLSMTMPTFRQRLKKLSGLS